MLHLLSSNLVVTIAVEECKSRALPSGEAGTEVADICKGEKFYVAYDVEDDDDDDDEDDGKADEDVDRHLRRRSESSKKLDEQARVRDRARNAARKFRTPSMASTRMTSSLDVLMPAPTGGSRSTSTSAIKVRPPVSGARPKTHPNPLRQKPEKSSTLGALNKRLAHSKRKSAHSGIFGGMTE